MITCNLFRLQRVLHVVIVYHNYFNSLRTMLWKGIFVITENQGRVYTNSKK